MSIRFCLAYIKLIGMIGYRKSKENEDENICKGSLWLKSIAEPGAVLLQVLPVDIPQSDDPTPGYHYPIFSCFAFLSAHARVENIGYADSVSATIAALGLTIVGFNSEIEVKWDGEMNEAGYRLVIGVFSLLCVSALLTAWRRIPLLEQGDAWSMLLRLGLRRKDIGMVFALQAGLISLIGMIIGITVSVSLPSFLP
jgi:hypothetical protein